MRLDVLMNDLRLNVLPFLILLCLLVQVAIPKQNQLIDLTLCIETFLRNSPWYKHIKLEFDKSKEQYAAATAFKYLSIESTFSSPYAFSEGENEVFYSVENEYRLIRRNTHTYTPSFSFRSDYYLPFDGRLSSSAGVYYNSFLSNLGGDRKRLNTFVYIDYEQPLFRENHYSLDSKIAEKEFKKSELRFNFGRNKLIANVIDWFYSVLQTQQKYELLKSQFRQKELTHHLMKDKYKLGKINELEFLQSEIEYKNSELNVLNQKELLENKMTGLCLLIGISPDTSYRCSGEMKIEEFDLPLEECLDKALLNNQEILNAALAKEISDLKIQKSTSTRRFNLSLVSSLTFDNRRDYLPVVSDSRFYDWSVGLRASLPLWDGGKSSAERNAEQIIHRQEEINLETMRNSVIQNIKKLYSAIWFERNRIDILRNKTDLTRKALELSRRLHEAGRLNMQDLLESEIKAKQAEIDLLNSIINYNKQVNTLKLETGMDFGI